MPENPIDATDGGATDSVTAPAPVRRPGLLPLVAALTVIVFAVDQLTKWRVLATMVPGERIDLVGSLLGLELVFNRGAALSIAEGMTWVLTLIALVVVVVVARASRRLGSRLWAVAFGLLLGGALGNLGDRFFRPPAPARGHVVDFIAYANWFVGNVADIAIVVAAVLVVLQTLRGVRLDGTREARGAGEDDPVVDSVPQGIAGASSNGVADQPADRLAPEHEEPATEPGER